MSAADCDVVFVVDRDFAVCVVVVGVDVSTGSLFVCH